MAKDVVDDYWTLLDELLLRYGDGWEHEWDEAGARKCVPIKYPPAWLRELGYVVEDEEVDGDAGTK